jgi:hypothetical protein
MNRREFLKITGGGVALLGAVKVAPALAFPEEVPVIEDLGYRYGILRIVADVGDQMMCRDWTIRMEKVIDDGFVGWRMSDGLSFEAERSMTMVGAKFFLPSAPGDDPWLAGLIYDRWRDIDMNWNTPFFVHGCVGNIGELRFGLSDA